MTRQLNLDRGVIARRLGADVGAVCDVVAPAPFGMPLAPRDGAAA